MPLTPPMPGLLTRKITDAEYEEVCAALPEREGMRTTELIVRDPLPEDMAGGRADVWVYLAGAINGRSDAEANNWRDIATDRLPCRVLNPMHRDYRGRELDAHNVVEIVENDKRDILLSDAVLVNYTGPTVGTMMEILYAWENSIPVYLMADPDRFPINMLSPWLHYHCTAIVPDLTVAIDLLSDRFGLTPA